MHPTIPPSWPRSLCLMLMLMLMLSLSACYANTLAVYPQKSVRLVVPFSAGGGTDILGRTLAMKLSELWGQAVVVDNRPGGGTVLGSDAVAKSAPDGYTLLLTANPHTSNPALLSKLPYDTLKDFSSITMLAAAPLLLVVNTGLGVNTVRELIEYAKSHPHALAFASSGNGGPQHLAGELFNHMAGVKLTHVPYKGSSPALVDLVGNVVQISFTSRMAIQPLLKTGALKVLASTSLSRAPTDIGVPTLSESGLDGFESLTWYGLFCAANTPSELIEKIQTDSSKALRTPSVMERLNHDGVQGVGSTPVEFQAFIKKEIESTAKLVQVAGIKERGL